MNPTQAQVNWDSCTPEGSILDQLDHWRKLTLLEKLTALEEMCDHARSTVESRRKQGLPYIDPFTNELVTPGHV